MSLGATVASTTLALWQAPFGQGQDTQVNLNQNFLPKPFADLYKQRGVKRGFLAKVTVAQQEQYLLHY